MIKSRYRRIVWFFARVILSLIAWDILLPRLGLRALTRRTRPERLRRIAVRFRGLAIDMGGVMIKVGQFLSARLDVMPRAITDELAGLQDEVRAESLSAMRAVVEAEMNMPLANAFATFDPTPLAAASIGQVHRAQLDVDGSLARVVVKIQRPNIPQIVDTDLAALRVVSRWANYYPPIHKRANVPALLEEFSRSLYEEIDYLHEGSSAETFAKNFVERPGVCVPRVFWSHTTRRVLTLEEIEAIKITDYARIEAAGIPRAEVAKRLLNTYLQQIFEDRFFHADPHPGNLFVLPLAVSAESSAGAPDWKLVFVDFGMTGTVSPNQLTALREMLIAIGTQDIPRLIRAYQVMGVLLPGADVKLLEKATHRAFERFWGKSTTEMVSMGHEEAMAFAQEFSELLYDMPFQVPENLILLGRCLSILSGICTGLDPNFNIWTSIMPYARRLIEAEAGGKGRNVIVEEGLGILRSLAALPGRADALFQRVERGQLEVQSPDLQVALRQLTRESRHTPRAIVFAAFLVTAAQLYLGGDLTLAAISAGLALVALLSLGFR